MLEESILFSHQFTECDARNCPECIVSENKTARIVLDAPVAQPTPNIMSHNGMSMFCYFRPSLDYM
jgi:hypothetical protein